MASTTKPGDGQTNPFGNGKGGGGPKAAPFDQFAQMNMQRPHNPGDIAEAQVPAGGPMLYADPMGNGANSKDIGTRPLGMDNRPPFRLKG